MQKIHLTSLLHDLIHPLITWDSKEPAVALVDVCLLRLRLVPNDFVSVLMVLFSLYF